MASTNVTGIAIGIVTELRRIPADIEGILYWRRDTGGPSMRRRSRRY